MASPQIRVSERNWKRLNSIKDPGDDFDDAINKLFDEVDHLKFITEEEDRDYE